MGMEMAGRDGDRDVGGDGRDGSDYGDHEGDVRQLSAHDGGPRRQRPQPNSLS